MITFQDGIAEGHWLRLARAPLYLRVVIDRENPENVDALDQLMDVPRPFEAIHAYRLVGEAGFAHVDYRDKEGKRASATYAAGTYVLCDPQPTDEQMRDWQQWRAWCAEQAEREKGGQES